MDTDSPRISSLRLTATVTIESAHYVDKDGNKLLYDKEGYQTDIIVKEDGTFEKDGKPVTVNENGDAVDENGTLLACGVKSDMQIKDNVIIMKDAPTDIHFDKVDSTTGKSLAGAVLQVIDKNGAVVSEWTTDETGAFDLKATLVAENPIPCMRKKPWMAIITAMT